MAKSKADKQSKKRELAEDCVPSEDPKVHPAKKTKLLDDSDDDDADGDVGRVSLNVNEDYARRFEYNKRREEKQRRM